MRRDQLIEAISAKFGSIYPKVDIEKFIDAFIDFIIDTLVKEKRIEIRKFGTFELRRRPGRTSRAPKSGKEFTLPDRYVPFFKPSKVFKNIIMERTKP
ncbi:MAG: integration host factor subunit beta [bacterium]|nr:integration host factor subunit beta [bacterium]